MGLTPGIPLPQQYANAQAIQSNLGALPAPTLGPVDLSGGGGPPAIPAPSLLPAAQPNQILTDEDKLSALRNSGAGVDQIHNPLLHGLAKAGDIASQIVGSVFSPARAIAAATPGTTFHHQLLVHQAQQNLANDQAFAQKQAQTDNLNMQPQLKEQAAELAQEKQNNTEQHQKATLDQQRQLSLARNGQMEVTGPDGQTHIVDDPDSQVFQSRKILGDYHTAQIGLDQARAELAQAGNDPNSPAYQLAMRRVQTAQENASAAAIRAQSYMARYYESAYGTGVHGEPLPGSMELPDGTPVGTSNAPNVRPTGTQRDAAGRAVTMQELGDRIGEKLNDPHIQQYLGPVGGRLAQEQAKLGTLPADVAEFYNDLKSYGAFQAGMHPVRGIGALNYFDQVMGGLAQTPEQLRGKLHSNAITGQSVQRIGTPRVVGGEGSHSMNDPLGIR